MTLSTADARDRWLRATTAERAELGPRAVATCAEALGILADRLAERSYPVAEPLIPCSHLDDDLRQFADAGVTVPPALEALWRVAGNVCFVDLDRYRHVEFWRAVAGDGMPVPCCDGIVIDAPAQGGWTDYILDMLEDMGDDEPGPAIEIAPDDLHKDNVSGSGPYEILLPAPGDDPWLAVLDGFRWGAVRPPSAPPDPPDLVSYLRTAVLECGGFPGLFGDPRYASILAELVVDLPPF